MFDIQVYQQRRSRLRQNIHRGLLVFMGNNDVPMNYPDNTYHFRQDSSFLYYFGLDMAGLRAVIDLDIDEEWIFGDDLTIDDIVWMGRQPSLSERADRVGVNRTGSLSQFEEMLRRAKIADRPIHFLPQYRQDNLLQLARILEQNPSEMASHTSVDFIRAVVQQRTIKSEEEILEIEKALVISREMQVTAMQMARPGIYEREIAGAIEGIAQARGGHIAFPTILTVNGQTLHNHYHGNQMQEGDMILNDSGAESALHYASDITRTCPVGKTFTARQREIYQIVWDAQQQAIEMIRPGARFRDVHFRACLTLAKGLAELGLMHGDMEEAVEKGAHALFFPCGLGHMMGLDVHDMEGLGENYVGYSDDIQRRSEFGWKSLRLAKAVEAGYVVTVEPGIYFIPELIDQWRSEEKFKTFITYSQIEAYRDFGGIRIEDDVLVTTEGNRLLGPAIPGTIEEIEAVKANAKDSKKPITL